MTSQLNDRLCDLEARSAGSNATQPLPSLLCTAKDEESLREQIRQIDGNNVERVAILSFRALQLYRIAKLQSVLVQKQNTIMGPTNKARKDDSNANVETNNQAQTAEEEKDVDELLRRYGKLYNVKCDKTVRNRSVQLTLFS